MLTDRATGQLREDHPSYRRLRGDFIGDPILKKLLPEFVLTYRNLDAFWPFIRNEADTYADRRQFISLAFAPLMDHLEDQFTRPGDAVVDAALTSFDAENVNRVWSKALARRSSDPEGAITAARTLLETTIKRILDESGQDYSDHDDLPKLYKTVSKALNLAPSQHSEEPIKAILGGMATLVSGLGTLRNRLSDSHGHGTKLPVRPSPRHASLAVNAAGTMAAFLVETYQRREERTDE